MKKNEVTQEVSAQMDTLRRRFGAAVQPSQLKAKMAKSTRTDVSAAQYAVGDELLIPEDEKYLFENTFNGRTTYGVVCASKDANGTIGTKSLYFSALSRSMPAYNSELQQEGTIEARTTATHAVFDDAFNCATDLEVFEAFKGKSIKVVEINEGIGARYNNGVVVGTRPRKVAVFDYA